MRFHPREREVFVAALERRDPQARIDFVAEAAGDDLPLRRRVEELLQEVEAVSGFLDEPAIRLSTCLPRGGDPRFAPMERARVIEKPGDRIGSYRLVEQIGEGGCGTVFRAEQEVPLRRQVALKVIKLGMDTRRVIARFEAERQALAMMDHPNIARVLDAGATETGRPYFVMEFVAGVRITEYCDQNELSTASRLRLFIRVCHAVQHAHQKGIIHRDLKPSNILVASHDGQGVPKIIDFGIAKATEERAPDQNWMTDIHSFIGTPAYMSPEQAEMGRLDIDTRSDIYALGILLYELLSGRLPFEPDELQKAGLDECRRLIREKEPSRPSTRVAGLSAAELHPVARHRKVDPSRLARELRGDLDWIVMRCLEKNRTRRYATASELALDLQRFLDDQPVLARPPSAFYRLQKLLRRNWLSVGAAAAVLAALVLGAGVSVWQAIRATAAEEQEVRLRKLAEREGELARRERSAARLNEYIAEINLAHQSVVAGNLARANQLVQKHRPKSGEKDLRGFEWRYLWALCQGDEHIPFPAQAGSVSAIAFSPDGRYVAAGLPEQVSVLDTRTGANVVSLPMGGYSLAFCAPAHCLIVGGRNEVIAWETSEWTRRDVLDGAKAPMALSVDSTRVAANTPDGITLWETRGWSRSKALPGTGGPVVFSPDGTLLATDSNAGITIWRVEDAKLIRTLDDSVGLFPREGRWFRVDRGMVFSADGRYLMAARNRPSARGTFVVSVWDVESGREIKTFPTNPNHIEHTGVIASIALSPDGRTVATGGWDHSVRLWDFPSGQPLTALHGHLSEVWAVGFTPDGKDVVSGAKDGGLSLWPAGQREDSLSLMPAHWVPLGFSVDGRLLAAMGQDGVLVFFDVINRTVAKEVRLEELPAPRPMFGGRGTAAISQNLRWLVQVRRDGSLRYHDLETRQAETIDAGVSNAETVAMSPDGQVVLAGGWEGRWHWWEKDRPRSESVPVVEAMWVGFSADSSTLVAFQRGNAFAVWDVAQRNLRSRFEVAGNPGLASAISPDGSLLATSTSPGGVENLVQLWDTASGRLRGSFSGHKQGIGSIAFSADGRTLATSSHDSTVRLWNVATQQELLSLQSLGFPVSDLMFSPDDHLLIGKGGAPGLDGGVRVIFRAPPEGRKTKLPDAPLER